MRLHLSIESADWRYTGCLRARLQRSVLRAVDIGGRSGKTLSLGTYAGLRSWWDVARGHVQHTQDKIR